MKVYLESVTKHIVAERVTIPNLDGSNKFVPAGKVQAREVRVVVTDPEDAQWELFVGQEMKLIPIAGKESADA